MAEVLELSGKQVEAAPALAEAIALYERKGSIASIERAPGRGAAGAELAALDEATSRDT
jgi:hypothetical protein